MEFHLYDILKRQNYSNRENKWSWSFGVGGGLQKEVWGAGGHPLSSERGGGYRNLHMCENPYHSKSQSSYIFIS